jgi:peroxiredoxin Q/BCP
MTSGCTQQACGFRDALAQFGDLGVTVLAISPDPVKQLVKFREKEGLTFPLLSDESHEVLEAYGVWVEKSMYGRTYMGVERSTFVVGSDGALTHADYKVKPADDAQRVLALLG